LSAEILGAGCLRQTAFDNLNERKIWKRFVSFVAAAKEACDTIAVAYTAISAARRVFPTPGSPAIMTKDPLPLHARSIAARIAADSFSRPTKRDRSASENVGMLSAADETCV
jgi:hypothetical protein